MYCLIIETTLGESYPNESIWYLLFFHFECTFCAQEVCAHFKFTSCTSSRNVAPAVQVKIRDITLYLRICLCNKHLILNMTLKHRPRWRSRCSTACARSFSSATASSASLSSPTASWDTLSQSKRMLTNLGKKFSI